MKKYRLYLSIIVAITIIFVACEPKMESGLELGPVPTADQIDFTFEPGADDYHYILTNTSSATGIAYWDLGNGRKTSGNVIEVHYPDIDTYTITMTLVTSGGTVSKSIQHEQTVTDPLAGNLVKGGKFLTAEDSAEWTLQYPDLGNKPTILLHGGWAFWDNNPGSWGQGTIYQAIDVVADQPYKVDLYFETAGAVGGWFKVYACLSQPVDGTEYTGQILVSEIGIWKDWNQDSGPVSGMFSDIHTSAGLGSNIVTFDNSGTIYLLIQCGANDLQAGVRIKNVEFRAYYP